jgi:hypothetical protein
MGVLSGFSTRACFPRNAPPTCVNEVPLETVANRSVPMACGPNVDQARPARGGSGAPHREPWLARRPPPAAPDKRARLAIALLGGAPAGSGPGTSPYVGAVPGQRHGYPSPLPVQTMRTIVGFLDDMAPAGPITPGVLKLVRGGWGRRDSNPAPGCFAVRGRDGEGPLTCDPDSPTLTARARRGPAVPDAVRTQHGPAPLDYLLAKPDRPAWSPATAGNGAGRGRCGVVRDCPVGTSQDRCEWHGSGTAGENDACGAWQCRHQPDRRVRLDPGRSASLARAAGPATGVGGIRTHIRIGAWAEAMAQSPADLRFF